MLVLPRCRQIIYCTQYSVLLPTTPNPPLKFVNTGSRGKFLSFVSKVHRSASLSALSKKNGRVRPIAVSQILRRLIAKCLVKEAKSEAIELFDCFQLGVGISRGAEAIIHSAKTTYEKILNTDSKEGVLQIDFLNAFNSFKRSKLTASSMRFQTRYCSLHKFLATLSMFRYCIITTVLNVNRVFK